MTYNRNEPLDQKAQTEETDRPFTQADRDRWLDMATEFTVTLVPAVQTSAMTLDDCLLAAAGMATLLIKRSKEL